MGPVETVVDIREPRTPSRRGRRGVSRDTLLDAALRVIRRDGQGTAMEAIAAEAGISRPILYRHFGDVCGLYQTVAARYAGDLLAAMSEVGEGLAPGRDLVRAQVDRYLAFLEVDPNLYRFLTRQFPAERPGGSAAVAGFVEMLGDLVAGYLKGLGMPAVSAATAGRAFVGSVQAAGEWWLESREVPRAVVADELADFLWAGFQGSTSNRRTPRRATAAAART